MDVILLFGQYLLVKQQNDINFIWLHHGIHYKLKTLSRIVTYVTAHRCAGGLKKTFDLRFGSQRHRHFVWFFYVPVQAPTRWPSDSGGSDTFGSFRRVRYLGREFAYTWLLPNCLNVSLFHTWVELKWLFNVTINDISVLYVTAHRCAGGLKKLDLRSGSHAIDIS